MHRRVSYDLPPSDGRRQRTRGIPARLPAQTVGECTPGCLLAIVASHNRRLDPGCTALSHGEQRGWLAVARAGERRPVTLGRVGREGPASIRGRSATRSPDNLVERAIDGAFY